MSNPISLQKPTVPPQPPPKPLAAEAPSFLQTLSSVAKVVLAFFAAIGGIAAFAVGMTITPFVKEGGIASFVAGAALFGTAGTLIYNR